MKVFLSYADQDRDWARRLGSQLQEAGLQVWDQARELLPGDNWADKLGEALEKAEAMVVLLSPHSVDSPSVRREIQYALGSTQFKDRLIPVVLAPTERIPWILQTLSMIRDDDPVAAGQRIAARLKESEAASRTRSREAR